MNPIQNSSKLTMLVLVVLLCAAGCKSKKKAMEAAAAEKARMEQEAQLKRQQEEAELKRKAAEESARREAEERERQAAAERAAATPAKKLGQYFNAISSASSVNAANSSINEALALFASPETPVLIVIAESGGQKDYDRPTTIQKYLNYLKDQKKTADAISDLKFDGNGKITEVELKK